jgi:hypothetical protein
VVRFPPVLPSLLPFLPLTSPSRSPLPSSQRYPDILQNATHSTSYLGALIASRYPSITRDEIVSEIFQSGLGIADASTEEVDEVWRWRTDGYRANRALADCVRSFSLSSSSLFKMGY